MNATQVVAFTNNADFKFTLTADGGYLLNLTALDFDGFRGGAGTPRGWAVRTSVDGFASVLATSDFPTARPTFTHINLSLAGAAFQNLSTITFKIYAYSPATGSSVDFDTIVVSGTAAAIPFNGYKWQGTQTGNWDTTATNWTGTLGTTYVDNTLTSDVLFDDSAAPGGVTVTPAPMNPHSIIISTPTRAYTIGGNAVSVATGLTKSGAASMTINNAVSATTVTLGGGTVTVSGGGSLTSAALGMTQSGTLTVASDGTLGAASVLSANGTVNFNNAAQSLTGLAGTNTGTVTLNGTALTVTGASTSTARITGNGSLVKNAAGILALGSTTSDFNGGTTVAGGNLQLTTAQAAGTGGILVNSGGSLTIGAAVGNAITLAGGTLGTSSGTAIPGNLIVNSTSTVATFNPATGLVTNDLIVTGMLQGSGNLNLQTLNGNVPDSQAFRLRGPVSTNYTGTITVPPSGKFELQSSVSSGSQMGTGTLVMTGGTNPTTNQGSYSLCNVRNSSGLGTISDTSFGNNVQVAGTGIVYFNMLTAGAPNNVLPGSRSNFGDLLIGNNQTAGVVATASPLFTLGFASVHLNGGNATFAPQPVGNTNFVSIENLSLGTISENIPGSGFTMNGAATLTLTAANNYTGATIIKSGATLLGAAGALPSITALTVNGGTLDLNNFGTSNDQTVGSLAGAGGIITNSDGANTRTLTVNQASGSTAFAGAINDTLALTKSGGGMLTLSAANTYTGATTVNGGTLCITGSIDNTSGVTVAAGATLCASGGYTLTLNCPISNNGTIRISNGAHLDASNSSAFVNNGILDLLSGTADLPPGFTNGPTGIVLDSSSLQLASVSRAGNTLTVTLDSYSGHTYQLQRSTALNDDWTDASAAQPGATGTTLTFNYDDGAAARGFFRVVVDPLQVMAR